MIRATHLDCWGLAVDCGDLYRVRWFRARDGLVPVPAGTDPAAACVEAAGTDRSLLATVEADGGAGPVVYLAAGGAGVVWDTETVDSATDIVLRMWEVEGAGEVTAPSGLPELVLGEVVEAADELFGDMDAPRLLTLEEVDSELDAIEVVAVRWWDPSEFENLYDDEE